MNGNKTDNGVHEIGTEEICASYKADTPGQAVDKHIKDAQKDKKENTKKHFSQVFQNPLKGFPYNEEFEVHLKEAVEEFGDLNERLDLVLQVKGDKNVKLAKKAMKKFKGVTVKRRGTLNNKDINITFGGDEKQLHKMQSALARDIKGLDMTSRHEELEVEVDLDEGEGGVKTALTKKADKSGMPYGILKKVFDRGVAAWRTGHRPGTNPTQWGLARVNSFATKSKGTWGGADKDLASKVS